ncbi:D-alanyl-D-alanine carboxypeptidase family protein [Planococcus sp. ISL-110]|uniref:D-alanyl-D-alanine carboxypeptidase family protein n=1 Tax=Planococcus sp. ISL-110 TaxID=2819167 RepID=UPI001BE9E663|nr:D-alanyl-D-alanine carboxypeptidase family protein [Planococcus sp. ISL-110]MBT2571570.1 D-alanyl-D-alanine carboxypeptidase family protein [Planococcus sp. ISL-110]
MGLPKILMGKKLGLSAAALLIAASLLPQQGVVPIGVSQASAASSFQDVTTFKKEIDYLAGLGVIKGFPGGSFKPAATITRLDAVRMILREMESEKTAAPDPGFADLKSGSPGYEEVAKAVELGFIEGKKSKRGIKYFDAKAVLTRAEMAKILTEAYNLTANKGISFTDVGSAYWANVYISRLATAGITNGFPGGAFKPKEALQRQHFAGFMARLLAPAQFPLPAAQPEKPVTYKTNDQLNMRSKAGVGNPIVASIPEGATVEYLGKEGNWYKVEYGTKAGWVNSAYLTKETPGKSSVYPAPSIETPGTYVSGVLIVNKNYSLPSSYNPGVSILAQKAVDAMMIEAKKQGVQLTAFSTFRSYNRQKELYTSYVSKHGAAEANRFSAKPGHSEHQTGLAFDFGGSDQSKWLKESFEATKEGKWLAANAHNYGFILRYPKGKETVTGYMHEPWHYRYLGSELAGQVKDSGKTLEEYVNK